MKRIAYLIVNWTLILVTPLLVLPLLLFMGITGHDPLTNEAMRGKNFIWRL